MIVLLVVAALVVAGELGVREVARRWTAQRLQDITGGRIVMVDVGGRPLAWHLLHRHVPAATIVAEAVPVGDDGAAIHELRVELVGIDLPRGRDGTATHRPLRARDGRFEAVLAEEDVAGILDLPRVVRDLSLTDDGRVQFTTVAGVRVAASLDTRDGAILVRPHGGLLGAVEGLELAVPLPELPAGAVVHWVEVRGHHLVAGGRLDGDRLDGR